jgi:hypothetical protein
LVDAHEVRNRSRDFQEFGNVGTGLQFHAIPRGQIWLSDRVPPEERPFLVAQARAELRAHQAGQGEDDAYDYGVTVGRAERTRRGPGRPSHGDIPADVYKGLWKVVHQDGEAVQVWVVDGQAVRTLFKVDFTEGAHGYVDSFVPPGEVWIEDQTDPAERDLLLLHELTERRLMKQEQLDYDQAHKEASKVEYRERQRRKQGGKPSVPPSPFRHRKSLPFVGYKANIPGGTGPDGMSGPGGPSAMSPDGHSTTRYPDHGGFFSRCQRDTLGRCVPGSTVTPGQSGKPRKPPQAQGQAPRAPRPAGPVATLGAAVNAIAEKIKAAVPRKVRTAAVAFCNYQLRKYSAAFGEANARRLIAAAGLLAAAPIPGAAPLAFTLVEAAYWSLRGAKVVSGRKDLATDQQLAEAVLAVLAEWYAALDAAMPAFDPALIPQALALVGGEDDGEGGDDGQGGEGEPAPVAEGDCRVPPVEDRGVSPRGTTWPSSRVPASPFRHRKGLHHDGKASWFRGCPRDEHGRCLPKGSAGAGKSGASAPAPRAEQATPSRTSRPKPKHVTKLSRFRDQARRRRVLHALRNEGELSRAIDGINLPDSEAADCVLLVNPGGEMVTNPQTLTRHLRQREDVVRRLAQDPGGPQAEALRSWLDGHRLHFIEVKTMLVQAAGVIRMSADAVRRKRAWEARYGARFATVVFDDRRGRKRRGGRLYYHGDVGNLRLDALRALDDFPGVLQAILAGGGRG